MQAYSKPTRIAAALAGPGSEKAQQVDRLGFDHHCALNLLIAKID
jgi:hypothetical protein